ncbi:LexA family protein [Marinomonas transparens]|uniref:Helix-turn-helix domain-containing protein n=1 Tax=Marinomonas transparens TaxID=2795388 RepID=A0A934N0F1_9GAMM|nr:S24 family peptidase [Marinomonas transparens]MBJ7536647.1 helix-turn-helix domain-containing protein [Marinomonas transparens]
MKTLGSRIREKRKELGITQLQLSKLVGVSHVTISQWESDTTSPKGQNLYKLTQILKTQANWLISGIDSAQEESSAFPTAQPTIKKRPLISHLQAGTWMKSKDDRTLGDNIEWEESPQSASESAFWLKVIGDSMTSPVGLSICEGHLILVEPNIQAENGNLVLAKLKDSNEVTFKKLVIDAGQQYLKPLNPQYSSIEIQGNCHIVGVVKEAKLKL